jgi:polyphosphate kinase
VAGLSDNIRVRSILGRFLEHHRVWYFGNDGEPDVWLSSADWMGRNLFKRIEVAFPVRDPEQKRRVVDEGLFRYLTDNRDAWELQPDGRWIKVVPRRGARVRSAQAELLQELRGVSIDVAAEVTRAPRRRARTAKRGD